MNRSKLRIHANHSRHDVERDPFRGKEREMASPKPQEKIVHLHGFARWRDSKGNAFAPCGALIVASLANASTLQSSSEELPRVTCPTCREQARALGRAYAKARRLKQIEW